MLKGIDKVDIKPLPVKMTKVMKEKYFSSRRLALKRSGIRFISAVSHMKGYCSHCKRIQPMFMPHIVELRSKKKIILGHCLICKTEIYKGVKDGKRNI